MLSTQEKSERRKSGFFVYEAFQNLTRICMGQYLPNPLFSTTSCIFRGFLRDAVCMPGNQKPQSHLLESFQTNLNNLNYDPANRNPHKFVKVQGRGGQQWRQRHALQSQHFQGKIFQHRLEYNHKRPFCHCTDVAGGNITICL